MNNEELCSVLPFQICPQGTTLPPDVFRGMSPNGMR